MASFLSFFGILAMLLGTLALDGEIVVSETIGLNSTGLNETGLLKTNLKDVWSSNGTMQAQPYNILEVSCPQGYVLANKHCHRRA